MQSHSTSPELHYDGAPRPITPAEAAEIAEQEYDVRRSDHGWIIIRRGADGGWHYADSAYSHAAAKGSCAERRRALVRRILAGQCQYTVFYDRHRDRFYAA